MGEIRQNQKAKLSIKTADDSEKEFDCLIKEVHADRISLEYPQEILDYAAHLDEGIELPVKIFTPSGIKMYDAMVLNSPVDYDFVIEYVEDYIQIQRREYTRVMLETKVIIERKNENFVTKTVDISGGGIRFICDGMLQPGEEVGCLLYLPMQIKSIKAQGTIMKAPHLAKNQYIMLFNKIDERERDRIVQKCFELQAADYADIEQAG